jgi:hypothetical protein
VSGPADPGGRDAAWALLAARVSELAERVGGLQARVAAAEAAVEGQEHATEAAAGLAQEVARLSAVVTATDSAGGDRDVLDHPRVWAGMTAETCTEALRDLARWVGEILLPRYPHAGPVLAPCWPAHPAAVEELDWLYWDWTCWAAPGGRSRDAADWHDRWLPGVLARLGPELAGCARGGRHTQPTHQRAVPQDLQMPGYAPEQVYIERMGRAARAGR